MDLYKKNFSGILIIIFFLAACAGPTPSPTPTLVPPSATPLPKIIPSLTPLPSPIAEPSPTVTATPSSNAAKLASLHMVDRQNAWAIDLEGRILRSFTGLDTWQNMTPSQAPLPIPDNQPQIPAAFFLDATHAWLAYFQQQVSPLVLYTSDGGVTWDPSSSLPTSEFMDFFGPVSLYFIDSKTGWLWTQVYPGMHHVYPALFQTTDGGQTWKFVYNPMPSAGVPDDSLRGSYSRSYGDHLFHFADAKLGVAATGALYISQDGGKKWSAVELPAPAETQAFTRPYTYVAAPVFATPLDGAVIVTTYEFERVMLPPGDLFDGLPGAIYIAWTHDGGKTWTGQPAPASLGTLSLKDGLEGWFLGTDDISSETPSVKLFHTGDGGITWSLLDENSPLPLGCEMQFITSDDGYAFLPDWGRRNFFSHIDPRGSRDYFLRTLDGGRSWK